MHLHGETQPDELADLYVAVMRALDGVTAPRAQAVLSMAVLMTGEHMSLAGADLIAWIDQTANTAKAIATTARRDRRRPSDAPAALPVTSIPRS
ncbi:MAG: hypothetical protein ABI398_04920 [Devosia sp.]